MLQSLNLKYIISASYFIVREHPLSFFHFIDVIALQLGGGAL